LIQNHSAFRVEVQFAAFHGRARFEESAGGQARWAKRSFAVLLGLLVAAALILLG
jgi:hypothetical protein